MNPKTLAAICPNNLETLVNILDFVAADLTEQEWLTRIAQNEIGEIKTVKKQLRQNGA